MFNIIFNTADLTIAAVVEHKYEDEGFETTYDLHIENLQNEHVISIVVEVSKAFVIEHDLLKLVS